MNIKSKQMQAVSMELLLKVSQRPRNVLELLWLDNLKRKRKNLFISIRAKPLVLHKNKKPL